MTRLATILSIMLSVSAGSAHAQTADFEDLRALRFYLQQNDQESVQAELRRLRLAFPDWRPPSDLNELLSSSAQASVDEAAIWRLIERKDYSAARDLIEQGRQRVSGWTPPSDMLRVLETNEAQDRFDQAVSARDASGAIAVARRTPRLMSCDRINNAWLLAEMYVLAGQKSTALTTYRNTVQSCTNYSQMEPTLEKSSEVSSASELRESFAIARRANPGEQARLAELEKRLLGGGSTARQSSPAPTASSRQASSTTTAPTATPSNAPASSSGSLPLRGDSRVSQVRRQKEQEQFASCLANSRSPRSLDVLYERSWCAYSHDRPTEALVGFQAAARAGDSLGPNVRRDAHFGLALAYLSMNMTEQGALTASKVRLNEPQHREVESIVLDQRGVRAFRGEDFRQAVGYFNAYEELNGSLRRDLAIMRAYAYLNSGQRALARSEFERLHAQLATADTRAGLNAVRAER